MEINEEQLNGNIFKLNLSGRMDITGIGDIEKDFAEMTSAQERQSIIVDMSDVPYMSSIGIRSLLMNGKTVNRRGGKYVLLTPQPVVKDVLVVSGIDQLLTICDSLDDAINKVTS